MVYKYGLFLQLYIQTMSKIKYYLMTTSVSLFIGLMFYSFLLYLTALDDVKNVNDLLALYDKLL